MSNVCVFCEKIDRRDIDINFSRLDYGILSFAPLNPVTPGHMLFVPYHHYKDSTESPHLTGSLFLEASLYGRIKGEDFNLIVNNGSDASQTIFHLHIHYIPRRKDDGLILPWTNQTS